MVDFCIRHQDSIVEAQANALRDREQEQRELILQAYVDSLPKLEKKIQFEEVSSYVLYGLSAETYWLPISIRRSRGRIRVDLYRKAGLICLTDLLEVIAIQPWFEEVLIIVCDFLGLHPACLTCLQRYQWDGSLLHKVRFQYDAHRHCILQPHWHELTAGEFQSIIDSTETLERKRVWHQLFSPITIRGIFTETNSAIAFGSEQDDYLLPDELDLGFSWGNLEAHALLTAYRICWQLVKHAASAQVLAPHFLSQYVRQWPKKESFVEEIKPINFLLANRDRLTNVNYPDAEMLNTLRRT